MVCKILFYSEFPNIPDKAGKKTRISQIMFFCLLFDPFRKELNLSPFSRISYLLLAKWMFLKGK